MTEISSPDDDMGALCASLHKYWKSLCLDGREIPSRADFEPLDVARLLPYIFLTDVREDPLDFQYRIVGESIIQFSKHNVMGQWASEISHHRSPGVVWKLLEETVRTGEPRQTRVPYQGGGILLKNVPVICLPFSEDGTVVNKIVGLADYSECKRNFGSYPAMDQPGWKSSGRPMGKRVEVDQKRQGNPAFYSADNTRMF